MERRTRKKLNATRGGSSDLIACYEPENLYEITDTELVKRIRRILNVPSGPTFINAAVLLTAVVINQKFSMVLRYLGLEGLTTVLIIASGPFMKKLAVSTVFGITGGACFTGLVTSASVLIPIFALGSAMLWSPLGNVDCEKLFVPISSPPENNIVLIEPQSLKFSRL